jgi:hypothetical protein
MNSARLFFLLLLLLSISLTDYTETIGKLVLIVASDLII